jgi:alpha-glucosidase
MEQQPVRMLAALNIGEEHWSMDTGGFIRHPTSENYARWLEFAAFVPIMRVHGDLHEKRQPWVYGPDAQAAATKAIQLRYSLMPYMYAAEAAGMQSGVGIVRPLHWIFPDDPTAAQQTQEWMFGDALLVAPILEETATKSIYLPEGTWWDYTGGQRWDGSQSISWTVDTEKWADIPLFVRDGSIVATNVIADNTDSMHPAEVDLDIFPSDKQASFAYYEDDGATYGYEKGAFFRQQVDAVKSDGSATVKLAAPSGTFNPAIKTYLLRIHGVSASSVKAVGVAWTASQTGAPHSWSAGTDRFGPVTTLKIDAGHAVAIDVR